MLSLLLFGVIGVTTFLLIHTLLTPHKTMLLANTDVTTDQAPKASPLAPLFNRYNFLGAHKKESINEKLAFIGDSDTFEQHQSKRLIKALAIFIVFSLVSILFMIPWLLLVAVILGLIMYYLDHRALESAVKALLDQREVELPKFVLPFVGIYKRRNLLEALRESRDYAGPSIVDAVDQFIREVELRPGRQEPFHNFAKNLGTESAHQLANTLSQAPLMNRDTLDKRMDSLIEYFNRLDEVSYQTKTESVDTKLNMFQMLSVVSTTIVVFIMMAFMAMNAFGIM